MILYLVRHGKDDDAYRGGWSQLSLIYEGIKQSQKLADYICENNLRIDNIISSDLTRTKQTAQEINTRLNLDIEYSAEWREINNGILAGMLNSEALVKFPGLFFRSLEMNERYPDGESPEDIFNRIEKSFKVLTARIKQKELGPNVLLVTHGGVINIIYHIIKRLNWTNKSRSFPASNTGLHKLELIDGKWNITQENITKHLP